MDILSKERSKLAKWPRFGVGALVYVRYKDHVLFKDTEASHYQPWIRESVGWLDHVSNEYIRIVWERLREPNPPGDVRLRSTGLAILREAVLELRQIA